MPQFKYEARTKSDGAIVKGKLEARSRAQAVEILHSKRLVVVNLSEDMGLSLEKLGEINIGGVPLKEKVIFMRQLATMISAGLPLTQALRILKDQVSNPKFKKVLVDVVIDVEGGITLSRALKKTEGIFDDITVSLIEAGEESGNLDVTLNRLAMELEKKNSLNSKIKGAMIYPAIMILVLIGVIGMLIFVLIPSMQDLYETLGAEDLPGLTLFFMNLSGILTTYWWAFLIGLSAVVIGFKSYIDSPKGKESFHKILLKVPIFGNLITKIQIAQFTRILSLLLKSGVSIISALRLSANSLSNLMFRYDVINAKEEVEKGVPLAVPLARSEVFPAIVSHMVSVGEETGSLDQVLDKLADFYEEEVDNITNNLSTLLEPVMLILMGGAIGVVAAAVYLPIFNIAGQLS